MNTLKVLKAAVITGRGTDKIQLTLDHETPFPQVLTSGLDYGCHANLEAQAGYGTDWVRKVLGMEPEIINIKW
jgi:hypothetical protein